MAEKPDPELDELLDSAAKDFQKIEKPSSSVFDPHSLVNPDGSVDTEKLRSILEADDLNQAIGEKTDSVHAGKDVDNGFDEKFMLKDLDEQLKDLAAFAEQGVSAEGLSDRLKNLKLFGDDPETSKEFSDAIKESLQSLRENLSEAFPAAREGEDGDGDETSGNEMEALTNVMQQMMLSLFSKKMLLPSFKEMSEKYPAWLEENKQKLSDADFKRYTSQLKIVQEIVAELEKEESEDDKQHLDRMVELMGKAQELGQPPQDLTAQLGNAVDDAKVDAMLKETGADQCSIM